MQFLYSIPVIPGQPQIREGANGGAAYEFELELEGEDFPRSGQIVVEPHYEKGSFPANMHFYKDGQPLTIPVRLSTKKDAITLKSVDKEGRTFVFETCLPPPGCKEQPKCEPCEPL